MHRCEIARMLNRLCGCTTFNLYNVDLVPESDIRELVAVLEMEGNG